MKAKNQLLLPHCHAEPGPTGAMLSASYLAERFSR